MNKRTRVSLVIPVYNEVERIRDCLESIAAQSVQPFEVIVVDNNSTDGTVALARKFPFVRVITEERQGVVYARDTGFNAARGSIIGRIDADTYLATDWVATVVKAFENRQLAAISGSVSYRDVTLAPMVSRIDLYWRRRMAASLGRDVALQGANMALRRSAWRSIQSDVCQARGVHEDFDLAIHLVRAGLRVQFVETLRAAVCYRQANYDFASFCNYALISPRTYLRHGVKSGLKMYQVVFFVIALYPLISLLSRGYDERLGRFSPLKLLIDATAARPNPATYVD